jgi:hypothetical protein
MGLKLDVGRIEPELWVSNIGKSLGDDEKSWWSSKPYDTCMEWHRHKSDTCQPVNKTCHLLTADGTVGAPTCYHWLMWKAVQNKDIFSQQFPDENIIIIRL